MKIVVTGGSGFIGSHLVDSLIEKGHLVKIIDLKEPHRQDVDFCHADILDIDKMQNCIKGFDCIYHFAAFSNIDLVKDNPLLTIKFNILGTANILEAARNAKIKRFMLASSVYANTRQGHIYTTAKIASEMLCEDCYILYGLPYTILRLGTAYGPRSRGVDAVSIFVKNAINNIPIIVRGGGKQKRNFIYVQDLAEGSVAALSEIAINKKYTLAAKDSITIEELAYKVKRVSGDKTNIEFEGEREDDYQGNCDDVEIAFKELKWFPHVSLEEGIKKYADWYQKQ